MKKLIPFLVGGILLIGTFGCQETAKTGSETSPTNEATSKAPAKEAAAKTETAAKGATEKTDNPILAQLEKEFPGSKLEVVNKNGAVTIKGTVPSQAELKKIEPFVKKLKGVKSVKVEAKVAKS